MRRIILIAVITLAVFSCTYGGKSNNNITDSATMTTDGTKNAKSADSNARYQKKHNDRIKIETQ